MGHRSYEQYCPVAAALDVVGDRWTLLIMRELLIGDRRFTDLRGARRDGPQPAGRAAPRPPGRRARGARRAAAAGRPYGVPATRPGGRWSPVLRALARFGAERLDPSGDRRCGRFDGGLRAAHAVPRAGGRPLPSSARLDGEAFDLLTDGPRLKLRDRPDRCPGCGRHLLGARPPRRPPRLSRSARRPSRRPLSNGSPTCSRCRSRRSGHRRGPDPATPEQPDHRQREQRADERQRPPQPPAERRLGLLADVAGDGVVDGPG